MKIVFISDTHNQFDNIALDVPECDVLVHCGDIGGSGSFSEIDKFFQDVSGFREKGIVKEFVGIAGNHDKYIERQNEDFLKIIPKWYHYLQDSSITIQGIKFYGSPVTPRFCDWAFNRDRHVLQGYWSLIPYDVDVLITHGPPLGILDVSPYGQISVGDEHLRNKVFEIKPKIHAFGHIHDCYGFVEKNGVKFVNASSLNERYVYTNKPIVIDI